MAKAPSLPVQICEDILRKDLEYNREHNNIWPSANRIIEGMLARRHELTDAYEELYSLFGEKPGALKAFLEELSYTPVLYSEAKISKARQDRKDLLNINTRIAELSKALAELLAKRQELQDTSDFRSETLYHILDAIHLAAKQTKHYEFQWHVQEHIESLQGQFDLKYWPALAAVIDAIGADARNAEVSASDSGTEAATQSPRPGLSDFVRAFMEKLKKNTDIPKRTPVSDSTLASLINCALELDAERLLDADYIKSFRQRERGKNQVPKA
ncbi:hypothetical protein [Pseudomonas sp. DP-17]|uniref:hypothetical protein n=1 Tax=Pseudomonas sp. DP-17 TaxID=1580486 RepID=UPI001EFB173E|nr:hypothetical protein [Pseudomonas sp. DP-17]MCG8910286.1 hypothetical protein [Pseudomonas sp. DP-17]